MQRIVGSLSSDEEAKYQITIEGLTGMSRMEIRDLFLPQEIVNVLEPLIYRGNLYHYCGRDACRGILDGSQWFKSVVDLEDRNEGDNLAPLIEEAMKELVREQCTLGENVRDEVSNFIKGEDSYYQREYIFVGCYSSKNDSNLMWHAYGDDRSGYCISLNSKKFPESYKIVNVIYSKTRKMNLIKKILITLNEGIYTREQISEYLIKIFCSLRYAFKQSNYDTEFEKRIIYLCTNEDEIRHDSFRHIEVPIYDQLKCVMVGPKGSIDELGDVRRVADKDAFVPKGSIDELGDVRPIRIKRSKIQIRNDHETTAHR